MSDTKTEWRAKVDEDRGWCVFEGENIVADLLRPEDAHKIAAVNEMEAALLGPDGDNPQLTRISWLGTLLSEIDNGTFGRIGEDEDPSATAEMLQILRDLVTEGTTALAKARGEQ